jgi:parvulin-like peptidyl-prolyl isomerase
MLTAPKTSTRRPGRHSPLCGALLFALALSCAGAGGAGNAVESRDVLARKETAQASEVKQILLGWKWLESGYRRVGLKLDSRAEDRTQTATEELAQQLLARLKAGEPVEPLMAQYSEDEGSARGTSYTVEPQSRFVDEFKELALKLQPGESGIVRSQFGFHVMKRVR